MSARAWRAALVLTITSAVPAWCGPWPDFTGADLLPPGMEATYPKLADALAAHNRSGERTYCMVILEGTGGVEARDALDAMVDGWERERPLDQNQVVVLLALGERMIAVRGGAALQAGYGFQGERVDREIVSRYFVPYARDGDIEAGLMSLLRGSEAWFAAQAAPPAPGAGVDGPAAPVAAAPERAPVPAPAVETPAARKNAPEHRAGVLGEPAPYRLWPWGLGGGVLLAGGWLVLRRMRRSREKREASLAPARAFTDEVVALLDDVESLARRHSLLPFSDPDFEAPMVGDTLAAYDRAGRDVEGLRAHWLAMMTGVNQLKVYLDSPAGLDEEALAEIGPIIAGHDQRNAAAALREACESQLAALEAAHESADRELAALGTGMARIDRLVDDVSAAGFSVEPYGDDRQGCRSGWDSARGLRDADPLGAATDARDLTGQVAILEEGLKRVWECGEQLPALRERLADVGRTAAVKRSEGLTLLEDDGNPDPMIAQGRQECDAAELALNRAAWETAEGHLAQASVLEERAREAIRRQEDARAYCREALTACTARLHDLDGQWRTSEDTIRQLATLHADASWEDVAGHRDRAGRILESLSTMLASASASASDDRQQYFHAEDLLHHIEQQAEQSAALLDDIRDRLQDLDACQRSCREVLAVQQTALAAWKKRGDGHRDILDPDWEAAWSGAGEMMARIQEGMQDERPNWPAVADRLELLDRAVAEETADLDDAVAGHAAFAEAFDAVQREVESVQRWLAERSEDRPGANSMAGAAAKVLATLSRENASYRGAWAEAAKRLERVGADVRAARRLGERDVELAGEAQQSINRAQARVQEVRSFFREGVNAEAATAQRWLSEAIGALGRQGYEDAIERAGTAMDEASASLQRAEQGARERRRARNRRRMELLATTMIHAASAYYGARRGSQRSWHTRRHVETKAMPSRPTFPSRTFTPKAPPPRWGSGTSQSRW